MNRFLSEKEMLALMLRALNGQINAVAVEDPYQTLNGAILISKSAPPRTQRGVDIQIGVARQCDPEKFYEHTAIPAMNSLAVGIGDEPVIFSRMWTGDGTPGISAAEENNVYMRLWIGNDHLSGQFGRFDVLYRPANG